MPSHLFAHAHAHAHAHMPYAHLQDCGQINSDACGWILASYLAITIERPPADRANRLLGQGGEPKGNRFAASWIIEHAFTH